MVRCVKSLLKDAEELKAKLISENALDNDYHPLRDGESIYFAVSKKYKDETVEKDLKKRIKTKTAVPLKEVLGNILNEEELEIVKTAHDIVGDIAIIEIHKDLESKEKEIAEALLVANPQIKTVVRKVGGHEGEFRVQKMKVLAGVDTTITEYKENNCTISFDVQDVYFSSRLSTERKRISEQVRDGEKILVMFSGAAPYPCVLSKNTGALHIVGVEINPAGHAFGLENVKKNKIENVELYCGDVREVVPKLNESFDRIIMPLPKTAEEFLDVALPVAKPGCVIHLYGFYHVDEFDKAKEEVAKYCDKFNRKYEIIEVIKAGQQAPKTYRICVDFRVD